MQIDETELFDMLVAAYKRGAEWITSEVQAAAVVAFKTFSGEVIRERA